MKAYLFGWNPIKFKWADINADIHRLQAGNEVVDDWSIVSYKTVQPGDRAYMVRVGAEPKGIFASGHIASEPYMAIDRRRHYYRIKIALDVLLNPDKELILSMNVLKTGNLAEQMWTPQASGIAIRPQLVDEVECVWLDFLNRHPFYGSVE